MEGCFFIKISLLLSPLSSLLSPPHKPRQLLLTAVKRQHFIQLVIVLFVHGFGVRIFRDLQFVVFKGEEQHQLFYLAGGEIVLINDELN